MKTVGLGIDTKGCPLPDRLRVLVAGVLDGEIEDVDERTSVLADALGWMVEYLAQREVDHEELKKEVASLRKKSDLELNWTTEPPTEPGIYLWWSQPGRLEILKVAPRSDGKMIGQTFWENRPAQPIPVAEYGLGAKWAGPFSEPA